MSKQLFDEFGRCEPVGLQQAANETSRRYFQCEPPSLDLDEIFKRLVRHLGEPSGLDASQFSERVNTILDDLRGDEATANIANGVYVPFFIPANPEISDIGFALEEKYMVAVKNAFAEAQPEYDFEAQLKSGFSGKFTVIEGSRHEQLVTRLGDEAVVGVYFPAMAEFSVPAALEKVTQLPEKFLLTGGFDLCAVFVAIPDLLIRENGYPPSLWFTALQGENDKIGYHFEAYGYNLKFYRRSHLNQVAEYWWHGLTVLG